MKIQSISISNTYSFPHVSVENLYKHKITLLDNNGVIINIGANGSGKTNFLNIFKHIYKNMLYRPYKINPYYERTYTSYILAQKLLDEYRGSKSDEAYQGREHDVHIYKNRIENTVFPAFDRNYIFYSKGHKKSIALLEITLDTEDYKSIQNIIKYKEIIRQIAKNYSSANYSYLDDNFFNNLQLLMKNKDKISNVVLPLSLRNTSLETSLIGKESNEKIFTTKAVYSYLSNYGLIQSLIKFHNEILYTNSHFEERVTKKTIPELSIKTPFAFLDIRRTNMFNTSSSYENDSRSRLKFHTHNDETCMLFGQEYQGDRNFDQSERDGEEYKSTTLFDKCINNIKKALNLKLAAYVKERIKVGTEIAFEDINNFLNNDKIARNIYANIYKYTKLEFTVSFNGEIEISFIKNNNEINMHSLSSGERVFVNFILLFCSNLLDKNTLLLIDEPEIHMHPKMQKTFINLLYSLCKNNRLQVIIATHSPHFVSNSNIKNINRFFLNGKGLTHVASSVSMSSDDDKKLINILTTTNSSQVFFADKVVLVEGVSDEYLFRNYINVYSETEQKDTGNVEILSIEGKHNYPLWSNFLTKFKIKHYFIGDLDNIKQFIGGDEKKIIKDTFNYLSHLKTLKPKEIMEKGSITSAIEDIKATLKRNNRINIQQIRSLVTCYNYLKSSQVEAIEVMKYLKKNNYLIYKNITSQMYSLYRSQKVFILQKGSIENYTNTKHMLVKVLDFVNDEKNMQQFYNEYREIKKIFDFISSD